MNILTSGAAQQAANNVVPPSNIWYETGSTTRRYYTLSGLTDYGVDGTDLTNNNSVSFDGGYATFNGTNNNLTATYDTYYPAEMTIFYWSNRDGNWTSLPGQSLWALDGTNDIFGRYHNDGANKMLYVDNGDLGNNSFASEVHIADQTWYFTCVIRNGGTANVYTGITTVETLGSCSTGASGNTNGDLLLGSQIGQRYYDGSMSGFIVEESAWSQSKLSDQVDKGPYYNYSP